MRCSIALAIRGVFLTFTLGSCVRHEELHRLESIMLAMHEKIEAVKKETRELRIAQEELQRQVGCPSPLVREFMKACVSERNTSCDVQDSATAILDMISWPHVIFYIRPSADNPFSAVRIGQLKKLLSMHTVLSTTRLLIVALPASSSALDTEQAETTARKLRKLIIGELYPMMKPSLTQISSLPPIVLNSVQRSEILRKETKPLPFEPLENQKSLVLWAFMVDC